MKGYAVILIISQHLRLFDSICVDHLTILSKLKQNLTKRLRFDVAFSIDLKSCLGQLWVLKYINIYFQLFEGVENTRFAVRKIWLHGTRYDQS